MCFTFLHITYKHKIFYIAFCKGVMAPRPKGTHTEGLKNRVLGGVFGPNREEVTGDFKVFTVPSVGQKTPTM